MTNQQQLGIVALGSMGGNFARQAAEKDIDVVGVDPEEKPELAEMGVTVLGAGEYGELAARLEPPRLVYLSLPAGPVIDEELDALADHLDEGDVVMDGGNSFWRDSMRREEQMSEQGIYYLDTGTSGGPPGARAGACFMVGGKEEGFSRAEPVLDALSVEGGLLHTGPPGSGHFVKLVHNGVEFGMLQAIGEGVELLADSEEFDIDLPAVFDNWSNGSVVEGLLVELMAQELHNEDIETVPSHVEDTGEVNWLVGEAMKTETPIPVISQSVNELFKSRGNQKYAHRAIAMMRHGFGTHPFGENENIAKKRGTSRVGNMSRYELAQQGEQTDTS